MSIIKTIYNISPAEKIVCDNMITVRLDYHNQYYYGIAHCHPDNINFFSNRIGTRIATSRARIALMKGIRDEIAEEIQWKYRTLLEVTDHHPERFIDFPEFNRNYNHALKRLNSIKAALKKEEDSLKKYLEGLDKAIESITKVREKAKDI